MKSQFCPKCKSPHTQNYDVGFLRCKQCGYDELEPEATGYGSRKNQKEKAQFSPYKTGGSKRAVKK